jgi:hypothetical protein
VWSRSCAVERAGSSWGWASRVDVIGRRRHRRSSGRGRARSSRCVLGRAGAGGPCGLRSEARCSRWRPTRRGRGNARLGLVCPRCSIVLARWGHARGRQVRDTDGGLWIVGPAPSVVHRLRRHACAAPGDVSGPPGGHHRGDRARVDREGGRAGHRLIAALLGRPPETARRWILLYSPPGQAHRLPHARRAVPRRRRRTAAAHRARTVARSGSARRSAGPRRPGRWLPAASCQLRSTTRLADQAVQAHRSPTGEGAAGRRRRRPPDAGAVGFGCLMAQPAASRRRRNISTRPAPAQGVVRRAPLHHLRVKARLEAATVTTPDRGARACQ